MHFNVWRCAHTGSIKEHHLVTSKLSLLTHILVLSIITIKYTIATCVEQEIHEDVTCDYAKQCTHLAINYTNIQQEVCKDTR